jgi:uncharacterized protein Usg
MTDRALTQSPQFVPNAEISMALRGYRLTTAEILYHLPDHPALLQSYIWQDWDLVPKLPTLNRFLVFWRRDLDAKLHSIRIGIADVMAPGQWRNLPGLLTLQ